MSNKNVKRKTEDYYKEQAAMKAEKARKKQIVLTVITFAIVLAIALPLILLYGVKVTHRAEIEIEGYGTLKLELYGNEAPQTVERFAFLAEKGFYNNTSFHRISDLLIQGGCPYGDGSGGYKDGLYGEFLNNGWIRNDVSHTRGTISMAHSASEQNGLAANNTASSQFFIMMQDYPRHDGKYAAFGRVTEGMELLDQILADTPQMSEKDERRTASMNVAPEDQPKVTKITVKGVGIRAIFG